jgi:hypothetical protein
MVFIVQNTQFRRGEYYSRYAGRKSNSCTVLNKQDSSYLNFGDIEILVPMGLKDIAQSLLDKALLN